ncbi:MAG: PIN domain-containing protein [Mycobacterium sp.]|uniref:type II toxin-antitoxin system VapC family toxin n=1 Tax=Mycobacterium sp. TaxID=1785 RepID=UPI003BB4C000
MIVLDASLLIGHLESADLHHAAATAFLQTHTREMLAASVVTLAEVYAGAARIGRADQLSQFLAQLQIDSLDLPSSAAKRLGELRAATNLKMPDCCVLYTAEQHRAEIATFDDRLAARAGELGLVASIAPA